MKKKGKKKSYLVGPDESLGSVLNPDGTWEDVRVPRFDPYDDDDKPYRPLTKGDNESLHLRPDKVSDPVTTHPRNYLNFPKTCTHEPTAVFTAAGVSYLGGSCGRVEGAFPLEGALAVCLLGGARPTPPIGGDALWTGPLLQHTVRQEHWMSVSWPDYGIPSGLRPAFWRALHERALSLGIRRVVFYCAGGHGRTGTALSAMMIVTAGATADAAVDAVRKDYCAQAVETQGQCDYLTALYVANKGGAA